MFWKFHCIPAFNLELHFLLSFINGAECELLSEIYTSVTGYKSGAEVKTQIIAESPSWELIKVCSPNTTTVQLVGSELS